MEHIPKNGGWSRPSKTRKVFGLSSSPTKLRPGLQVLCSTHFRILVQQDNNLAKGCHGTVKTQLGDPQGGTFANAQAYKIGRGIARVPFSVFFRYVLFGVQESGDGESILLGGSLEIHQIRFPLPVQTTPPNKWMYPLTSRSPIERRMTFNPSARLQNFPGEDVLLTKKGGSKTENLTFTAM